MPSKSANGKGKADPIPDPVTSPAKDGGAPTLVSIAGLLEENRQVLLDDLKEAPAKLKNKLDHIHSTVLDHTVKIGDLEKNANEQDSRLETLEATCAKLNDSNTKLVAKVID